MQLSSELTLYFASFIPLPLFPFTTFPTESYTFSCFFKQIQASNPVQPQPSKSQKIFTIFAKYLTPPLNCSFILSARSVIQTLKCSTSLIHYDFYTTFKFPFLIIRPTHFTLFQLIHTLSANRPSLLPFSQNEEQHIL